MTTTTATTSRLARATAALAIAAALSTTTAAPAHAFGLWSAVSSFWSGVQNTAAALDRALLTSHRHNQQLKSGSGGIGAATHTGYPHNMSASEWENSIK